MILSAVQVPRKIFPVVATSFIQMMWATSPSWNAWGLEMNAGGATSSRDEVVNLRSLKFQPRFLKAQSWVLNSPVSSLSASSERKAMTR